MKYNIGQQRTLLSNVHQILSLHVTIVDDITQGPVVQSWVRTNCGLKFNQMFQFLYFYISDYFKTLQTKTTIDPDKISKETCRNTINKLLESLERNFTLTQG